MKATVLSEDTSTQASISSCSFSILNTSFVGRAHIRLKHMINEVTDTGHRGLHISYSIWSSPNINTQAWNKGEATLVSGPFRISPPYLLSIRWQLHQPILFSLFLIFSSLHMFPKFFPIHSCLKHSLARNNAGVSESHTTNKEWTNLLSLSPSASQERANPPNSKQLIHSETERKP